MCDMNLKDHNGCSYCLLFYKGDVVVKEDSKFLLTSEVVQMGIDNFELVYIGAAENN